MGLISPGAEPAAAPSFPQFELLVDDDWRPYRAEPAPALASLPPVDDTPAPARRKIGRGLWAIMAAALIGLGAGAFGGRLLPAPGGAAPGPTAPMAVAQAAPVTVPPPTSTPAAPQSETVSPKPAAVSRRTPARTIRPKAAARRGASAQARPGVCRTRCGYRDVQAADERLRQAYAAAARAGVPAALLDSYNSRWEAVNRQSRQNPTRAVVSYRDMTRQLSTMATEARSE